MKKVAVVTGVAGGIGRATAQAFRDAGWQVVGLDLQPDSSLDDADSYLTGDISDPEACAELFQRVGQKEGRIDALVNNAAIQICKPLIETSVDEWDSVMANNVRSVYLTTRYAHEWMLGRRAAIVNVASVHALATSHGMAAYAASKGALLALTRAVAIEMAQDGIRVNAVLPGAVDTQMLRAGLRRDSSEKPQESTDKLLEGLANRTVLQRVGQPREIARTILYLADDSAASFITGQGLVVDGGATARLSTH